MIAWYDCTIAPESCRREGVAVSHFRRHSPERWRACPNARPFAARKHVLRIRRVMGSWRTAPPAIRPTPRTALTIAQEDRGPSPVRAKNGQARRGHLRPQLRQAVHGAQKVGPRRHRVAETGERPAPLRPVRAFPARDLPRIRVVWCPIPIDNDRDVRPVRPSGRALVRGTTRSRGRPVATQGP
jgi:hypothetical protein